MHEDTTSLRGSPSVLEINIEIIIKPAGRGRFQHVQWGDRHTGKLHKGLLTESSVTSCQVPRTS